METGEHAGTTRRRRLGLALIAGVLVPAAVAGEASRPPTAAAVAPRPPAEAAATVPLDTVAATVAAWVAQAMGTALPAELPALELVEPERLHALRSGSEAEPPAAPPVLQVVALYDDAGRSIRLPRGWSGTTPTELSVLVHEMVHHLQNLEGRTYPCPAAREAEAYAIQERWLKQHGTDLATAFELNRLALFVLTSCGI
jgi:hypothetical protein